MPFVIKTPPVPSLKMPSLPNVPKLSAEILKYKIIKTIKDALPKIWKGILPMPKMPSFPSLPSLPQITKPSFPVSIGNRTGK